MGTVSVHTSPVGGRIQRATWRDFSFFSDGGTFSAGPLVHPPAPAIFNASIGLCAATQVQVFSQYLKVPLDTIRCVVEGHANHGVPHIQLSIQVTSSAPATDVAAVLSNAHAGCFAEQAIRSEDTGRLIVRLNGEVLKVGQCDLEGSILAAPTEKPVYVDNVIGPLHQASWQGFTFFSDEPPRLGGADRQPIPIAYFCGSIGMDLLTTYTSEGEEGTSCRVTSNFSRTGSVLAGTVLSKLDTLEIDLRSPADALTAELRDRLIGAASSSWAFRALALGAKVTTSAQLNGHPLHVDAYPRRLKR